MRRSLALSALGVTTLLTSNCALPPGVTWNDVQERGYITVLIDAKAKKEGMIAANTKPSEQGVVKVQAVSAAEIVRTPYAEAIPGRPGFVFSPHTTPRQPVDVHGFAAGSEVRCPYTNQPFLVPGVKAVIASTEPAPVSIKLKRTQVVSNASGNDLNPLNSRPVLEETPEPKLEPQAPAVVDVVPEMKPAPASSPPPAPSVAASNPKPETPASKDNMPYGKRVPGRPGFVYSPFASKSQLVDVAGTAPGVVVKCPYTNKMFRVPEMITEEVAPAPSKPETKAIAPAPSTPRPSAPETPQPARGRVEGDFATPQR